MQRQQAQQQRGRKRGAPPPPAASQRRRRHNNDDDIFDDDDDDDDDDSDDHDSEDDDDDDDGDDDDDDNNRRRRRKRTTAKSTKKSKSGGGAQQSQNWNLTSDQLEILLSNLMRLILFKDAKKEPVRREDITQLVFGEAHKGKKDLFQHLIHEAKLRFRSIFGFELVQIDKKSAVTGALQHQQQQRGGAKKSATQKTPTQQQVWILQYVSPSLSMPSSQQQQQQEQEIQELRQIQENFESNRYAEMQSESHAPKMALLLIILSLIHMNDNFLPEDALFHRLNQLGVERNETMNETFGNVEKMIESLTKQCYLDRERDDMSMEREAEEMGLSMGSNRLKVKYMYRAGSRAQKEISKRTISDFISQICLGAGDEDDNGDDNGSGGGGGASGGEDEEEEQDGRGQNGHRNGSTSSSSQQQQQQRRRLTSNRNRRRIPDDDDDEEEEDGDDVDE